MSMAGSCRRLPCVALLIGALLVLAALGLTMAAGADARSPLVQCEDGIDNDGDGKIDWPFDPGCGSSTQDAKEDDPANLAACADGDDDDGDGKVDFPADPGCSSAADPTEQTSTITQCSDGVDNDTPADGAADYPRDLDCAYASDTSETPRRCSNRADDDADRFIDFPADIGCANHNDDDEADLPQCDDGRDNDGDGNVDVEKDPDCTSPTDDTEAPPALCADGLDNDDDGLIDLADPGCTSAADGDEANAAAAACDDGLDNDDDGSIDLDDLGCASAADNDESDVQVLYIRPPGDLAGSSTPTTTTPLLSPFPIVRLRGRVDSRGARVTLLTVRAPAGSKVSVYCSGPSCPRRRVAVNAGLRLVRVRQFERRLRGGTILKVYVTKPGFIGKYTRFRFVNRRPPSRIDRCAVTPGTDPRNCPSS